jgi:hypothetical protein
MEEAKMLIYTYDMRKMLKIWAKWKTLKSLGVNELDIDLPIDVDTLISYSPGHKLALDNFLNAFEAWHDFHIYIDTAGKYGKLTCEENEILQTLITERDRTRAEFGKVVSQ